MEALGDDRARNGGTKSPWEPRGSWGLVILACALAVSGVGLSFAFADPSAPRSGESRAGESRAGESRAGESRAGESRASPLERTAADELPPELIAAPAARATAGADPRDPGRVAGSDEADGTARPKPRRVAVIQEEESVHWGTRIIVDRERGTFILSRELMFGSAPVGVYEGDVLLIPDEVLELQVSLWEQRFDIPGMEISVLLKRLGPEQSKPWAPGASTEATVWVNGQARVTGLLYGADGAKRSMPAWLRIAAYRPGGVLVGEAMRMRGPVGRFRQINGNLSTDSPWITVPEELFEGDDEAETAAEVFGSA